MNTFFAILGWVLVVVGFFSGLIATTIMGQIAALILVLMAVICMATRAILVKLDDVIKAARPAIGPK